MHFTGRVSDAFTSQMKFALSQDPQQLSPRGRALLQMAAPGEESGGAQAEDGMVEVFEAEMRILEGIQDDPSHFNILELKGEATSFQVIQQGRACVESQAAGGIIRTIESVWTAMHLCSREGGLGYINQMAGS